MTEAAKPSNANPAPAKTMDNIVALCRRKGFVFQSSEIYGGINGFWDYGPLGVELKRNLKDAWWHDIVRCPDIGPDKSPIQMVGVDCTIIMNPKVWIASGHAAGFNDPMVDDKETKGRFRADHLVGAWLIKQGGDLSPGAGTVWAEVDVASLANIDAFAPTATFVASSVFEAAEMFVETYAKNNRLEVIGGVEQQFGFGASAAIKTKDRKNNMQAGIWVLRPVNQQMLATQPALIPSPFTGKAGALTEPRQFNLMFESHAGAVQDESSKVWLRPETAQGIFCNFRNVVDSTRVRVPFGIAQVGKAFRNEVTPRNFTFRSREFEQMEIEFFIRPDTANEWYKHWRDSRFNWWKSIGLAGENLQLREHDRDELAHYAKLGAGTSDIEYRFPFTAPGFGELEGVAHRTDFDLQQHAKHSGLGDKLKYFDQELQLELQAKGGMTKEEIAAKSKYFPHVIEPSAGADRGTLALICEAFTPDPSRASGVYMKFHPRMAPVKAGIFPLVNKDGMPEIAENLYRDLRTKFNIEYDAKQTIGKRYARMDESGTPFSFTIDGDTTTQQTVTVRDRDTQAQERIALDKVGAFLAEKIGG
jgi:glycyl-tRNA synthetase